MSTTSVANSDYNMGWHCFAGGRTLPCNPSRAFVDGHNKARQSALSFAKSMNAQYERCKEYGVKTTIKAYRTVHGQHEEYRFQDDKSEADRARGERYQNILRTMSNFKSHN